MNKAFLRRVNQIEFHFDSYLRGYFIIPLSEIKVIHTTTTFTHTKISPKSYERLLALISKYLETIVIVTKALDGEGNLAKKVIVVGEISVSHMVMDFFIKLYATIEAFIDKLRIAHRNKSIQDRRKGKKVKGSFRNTTSKVRMQYIEYACNSITKLLDLKEKLPRKQSKAVKLSAIQYYINNTIPIKGNKHRLYARK